MGEKGEKDRPGDRAEEGFEHPKQPVGDQSQQPEEENLDDALAVHWFVIELSRRSAGSLRRSGPTSEISFRGVARAVKLQMTGLRQIHVPKAIPAIAAIPPAITLPRR